MVAMTTILVQDVVACCLAFHVGSFELGVLLGAFVFANVVYTHLFTCAIYGHGPQKHKCYEWHSGYEKQHHTTIEVIEPPIMCSNRHNH